MGFNLIVPTPKIGELLSKYVVFYVSCGGESMTKQLSLTVRPASTLAPARIPRGNRVDPEA
jgi:hypothetical protein